MLTFKVMLLNKLLLSLIFIITAILTTANPSDYPPPASVQFEGLALTIFPPDPLPDPPVTLIAYNIYVNDVFHDNIPLSPPYETVVYLFDESQLMPGAANFCVTAVYNDWISDPACDQGTVSYGGSLPFIEDWSSGDFGTNSWTSEGSHWTIETEQGSPAPSAVFNGQPAVSDYSEPLFSYYFRADSIAVKDIYVDFDLKIESNNTSGTEKLRLEVWNWSNNSWNYYGSYTNHESTDWTPCRWKITNLAMGKIFRIRFNAYGTQSDNIGKWMIDNVRITRECKGPGDLTVDKLTDNKRRLHWLGILNIYPYWPLEWDNGINTGNSIGTGGPVEFDVAARWTPAQMATYPGYCITEVGFVPAESQASYRIRIWQGDTASVLHVDQPVIYPEIGSWNNIFLDEVYPIDITKELWVGYYVNAQTGYPAGCDNGPAVDGYGNMMNYGGWQTLLEINPELDYNWNIYCQLAGPLNADFKYVNIYRQDDFTGVFQWHDSTGNIQSYTDSINITGNNDYCYRINAVYARNGDTCITTYSNDACDPIYPGMEEIVIDRP